MVKDVISHEAELSMIINSISTYVEFLISTIEEYALILKEVQDTGIEDDLIRGELTTLVMSLKGCISMLNECTESVANSVTQGVNQIAHFDSFAFPVSDFKIIESLIAQFS